MPKPNQKNSITQVSFLLSQAKLVSQRLSPLSLLPTTKILYQASMIFMKLLMPLLKLTITQELNWLVAFLEWLVMISWITGKAKVEALMDASISGMQTTRVCKNA